jgi:hypothetical protein
VYIDAGSETTRSGTVEDSDPFDVLRTTRKRHFKNLIVAHLNINSLRYKFYEICTLLQDNIVDLFIVSETKIDNSFPDAQFSVPGYTVFRKDRDVHGGGIIVYVKNSISVRRRTELETVDIENITLEVDIGGNAPWYIFAMYRPPKMQNNVFTRDITTVLNKTLLKTENIVLLGDLNYDLLKPTSKGKPLSDIIDIFDLKNIVKTATCITKENESLLDVILTSKPASILTHGNFCTGISDMHNMVYAVFRSHVKAPPRKQVFYRSYKHFNVQKFCADLVNKPFENIDYILDLDEAYSYFEGLLRDTIDEHAPLKTKYIMNKSTPYMNSDLRKHIRVKRTLFK